MANDRLSQLPVEVLAEGDPDARVSQAPVEVLATGAPAGRLSQVAVEVLVRPLFSASMRPFRLVEVDSYSRRRFGLLAEGFTAYSRRPFSMPGAIRTTSSRPFALEGPVTSVSVRPFALDASAPPTEWGNYVTQPRYGTTYLVAAAASGADTLYLASGSSIRVGQALQVGSETHIVAAVAGGAITLTAPLTGAQAAGAPVRFLLPTSIPASPTTVDVAAVAGDTSITVDDATGYVAGTVVVVGGQLLTIESVAGNVVTFTAPLVAPAGAGETLQPAGAFAVSLPVYDKAGTLQGSFLQASVTATPSREVMRGGSARLALRTRHPSTALAKDDWLVGMQTSAGEPPWAGAMTIRSTSSDGATEVQAEDILSILSGGPKFTLEEEVPDGTTALAMYQRALDLHNERAEADGEVLWELDGEGCTRLFRGDLDIEADTLGLIDHVSYRSQTEFMAGVRFEGNRLVPVLMVRDLFAIPGGPLLRDGDYPDASLHGVEFVEDPGPMVHKVVLKGSPFDLAECLPSWAAWAGSVITPEVTASVDPGERRLREAVEVTVDWGFSAAARAAACRAIEDELYAMYFDFLKAVHDIEGRPYHEGYLFEGVTAYDESRESGRDALSRRTYHTRLQLVETFPNTPASAVMISDSSVENVLNQWLIVSYNRATGVQTVENWAFPSVAGASMTKFSIPQGGKVIVYYATGGRIYQRVELEVVGGVTEGTAGFCESYSTRLWDPVAKRYRNLRRILSGSMALNEQYVGFIDPADPDITLTDLGAGAAIDLDTLGSLIGKVYDFELLNIDKWDPRRDGVGAYLSRPTIFNAKVTDRPRWHIVSYAGLEGASTSLVSGITATETKIEVATTLGFPRDDQVPFSVRLDDGPRAEIVTVTNIAGSLWTIIRAQQGTTAIVHEAGSEVALIGGEEFNGLSELDLDWPEGQQLADELVARLSRPRTLLNARVAMRRVSPAAIPVGTICPVEVETAGPVGGLSGDGRIIAVSPNAAAGWTEVVLEFPYIA